MIKVLVDYDVVGVGAGSRAWGTGLANVLKEPSVTFIAKFKIHHCREWRQSIEMRLGLVKIQRSKKPAQVLLWLWYPSYNFCYTQITSNNHNLCRNCTINALFCAKLFKIQLPFQWMLNYLISAILMELRQSEVDLLVKEDPLGDVKMKLGWWIMNTNWTWTHHAFMHWGMDE